MSDALIAHFRRMAQYSTRANAILYAACARLPDAERKRERPAFFRSIHGTLNHILVGDRIWLARFAGREVPSTGLDAILYEDFDALHAARTAEDARIEALAAGLTPDFLAGSIRYVNNEGKPYDDPVAVLLAHFFNHQTHHRGQVHGLLSHAGVPTPVLDLHRVLRPDPVRA
ncbi:MAG TPA: DinB family protein [bacterium]|nr:DinB family protein [bacterium]